MKQLKKNDGYVLPYVLAVFLVLSFVAVTICNISLENLRAQEASIARAQDLYEAEGKMESLVAQLCALTVTGEEATGEAAAKNSAVAQFWPKVNDIFGDEDTCSNSGGYINEVELTVSSTNGAVTVTAKLQVQLVAEASPIAENAERYKATALVDTVAYNEYRISHSNAEGGDGA